MASTMQRLIAAIALYFTLPIFGNADGKLIHNIGENGEYSFTASGNHDFSVSNGTTFLQAGGKFFSTSKDTMMLKGSKAVEGSDINGRYEGKVFSYEAGSVPMENQVLVYDDGRFVRFTQSFPKGVTKSNVSDSNSILSSFPSFSTKTDGLKGAGYLQLNGDMCGHNFHIDSFASGTSHLKSGQEAGPIVLFDDKGNAMVISAYSSFMAHNMVYQEGELQFGLMGGFTEVPTDYQIDTILYFGENGINRAVEGWGEVVTRRYGKTRDYLETDLTVNYIGYWTDNGAYYYYNTEKDKNYEETMLDNIKYFKNVGIPYKYLQYDSWWYYKDNENHGGVTEWVSRPDIFPNGSVGLFEEHGMLVAAHNRYWSSQNVYARQNGGNYQFLMDKNSNKSVPTDFYFWSDLFHNATKWGLRLYEQDWDNVEFEGVEEFHTDINLGKQWLMQMGEAARTHGQTIQYCMALSRHMMQSVEIPTVTQARVSDDYQPGNDQWKIGITSMFAHSLNIAPFKDTFWTASEQPGSPYGSEQEPYPTLQAALATFSTGPVGPSDAIGYSSEAVLQQIYNNDGLILKPSRAITMIDEQILNRAFPGKQGFPNVDAEIYSTYTDLHYSGMPMRHGYIFAADLNVDNFKVYPESMYLNITGHVQEYLAYHGHPGDDATLIKFNATTGLSIPKCGRSDFQLWYAAPVLHMSDGTRVAILGEKGKFVPVSRQRITSIEHKMDNLLIDISGRPDEFVQFGFAVNETVTFIYCQLSTVGQARISMKSKKCW